MKTNRMTKVKRFSKRKTYLDPNDPNYKLKYWIWVYFFLWIFEGALRKWVVPGLSQPLLLIRDPIVIYLIILASKRGLLKSNIYLNGAIIFGVLSIFTAVLLGHGNIFVALYGARILLLYFPMIFIIGQVFNKEDVLKMGEIILWISIPMALLLTLQFYSPQSAWVNKAPGGGAEGGFSGALGYFRPPGTFSFTNGNTYFFSLVAPFIIYFWLNPQNIKRIILIGATGALIIAIPLSISRALFFQVSISVIFLLIAVSRKPKYFSKILFATVMVAFTLLLFSKASFFQTATAAFTDRFEGANESEGGMVKGVLGERFLGGLLQSILGSADQSLFGFGIGSGTPFGVLLLNDNRVALMSDFEWMRELGELGIMGLFVIGLRVGLGIKISIASYRNLQKDNFLPWLLMSIGIIIITQGSWHQPTALGFFALVGGLWIASLKGSIHKKVIPKKRETPQSESSSINSEEGNFSQL